MSSSAAPSQPPEDQQEQQQQQQQPAQATNHASADAPPAEQKDAKGAPLPLPPPPADGDVTTTLDVNGGAVRLDHLGPLVVNQDGTMSRIANWAEMSQIERDNTLRILGKRNQLRLSALRGEDGKAKDPGQGQQ